MSNPTNPIETTLSDTMLKNNQQTHKETDSVVRYPHITAYQKRLSDPSLSNSLRYKNVLRNIIFEVTSGGLVVNDCLPDINPSNDFTLVLTTFIAKNIMGTDKRKVLVMTVDSMGVIGVHGVIHGSSDDLLFGQGLGFTQEPDGRQFEIHITGDETTYTFSLNDEYNLQPLENELHITKWVGLLNFFKDSWVSINYHLGSTNTVQQTVETTTTPVKDYQSIEALDVLINQRLDSIQSEISSLTDSKKKALDQITRLEAELKSLQDALEVIDKKKNNVLMEFTHLKDLKAIRETKV